MQQTDENPNTCPKPFLPEWILAKYRRGSSRSTQLWWLAAATFLIGTESLLIVGTLPNISIDLGVSLAATGSLVAIYAATCAVGAPFLAAASSTVDRKLLLVLAITGFAVANLIAAAANGFWVLFAARTLAAVTATLFAPAAYALAGTIAERNSRGRSVAIVNGGFSAAIAVGVPISIWIAVHSNWRLAFLTLGVVSFLAGGGLFLSIEPSPGGMVVKLRTRLAAAADPQILLAQAQSIVWTMGTFVSATFLAPLLQAIADADGDMIGLAFLISGVFGVMGSLIGGALVDRMGALTVLFVCLVVHAIALASFSILPEFVSPGSSLVPALTAVGVTGFASWAISSAQLARLLAAGSNADNLVLSLNRSAVYLGIALGSALGGLIIQISGPAYLGWTSMACQLIALLLLAISSGYGGNVSLCRTRDR